MNLNQIKIREVLDVGNTIAEGSTNIEIKFPLIALYITKV